MRSTRWMASVAGLIGLGALSVPAVAQQAADGKKPATPLVNGGLDFKTRVGSFKLLGAGEIPVTGKLRIKFNGTVLVSGLEKGSKIATEGKVLKEIDDQKHQKSVYHGNGTLVIDGKVRAVQFFGRDLDGKFLGRGIFRFYGEFDKNLETGTYKYVGSANAMPWGTGGVTLAVPSAEQATPKPKVRIVPKGG